MDHIQGVPYKGIDNKRIEVVDRSEVLLIPFLGHPVYV